jgi:hypothetical protein
MCAGCQQRKYPRVEEVNPWRSNLRGDDRRGAVTELIIRTLGGFLQIGGFVTVALGITAARRRWAPERGILLKLGRGLDRLIRSRAEPVESISGILKSAEQPDTNRATGIVTVPNPTLEDRVAALESEADNLAKQTADLAQEARRRAEAVEEERTARERSTAALATNIEELAVGNLTQETVGVVLFVVGVVLTTWAPELARIF